MVRETFQAPKREIDHVPELQPNVTPCLPAPRYTHHHVNVIAADAVWGVGPTTQWEVNAKWPVDGTALIGMQNQNTAARCFDGGPKATSANPRTVWCVMNLNFIETLHSAPTVIYTHTHTLFPCV